MVTDPLILAYCAGVLDSDGSISIVRKATNWRYPDSFSFTEYVQVGQTGPEAVMLFASLWKGSYTLRPARRENWRALHVWTGSATNAVACIRALRPYLRVKGAQADLAMAMRESLSRPRAEVRGLRVGVRGVRINPDVTEERLALWREIRALNDTRLRTQV